MKLRGLHLKLHSHFVLILVVDVGRSVPGSKLCAPIIKFLSGDEAVDYKVLFVVKSQGKVFITKCGAGKMYFSSVCN